MLQLSMFRKTDNSAYSARVAKIYSIWDFYKYLLLGRSTRLNICHFVLLLRFSFLLFLINLLFLAFFLLFFAFFFAFFLLFFAFSFTRHASVFVGMVATLKVWAELCPQLPSAPKTDGRLVVQSN